MSDKKTLHTPQREVPQNTKSTVVRLFSQLRGQRARLTVVGCLLYTSPSPRDA